MFVLENKSAKQLFNHGILTTFGKLDAVDIDEIDGCADQLIPILIMRYGWSNTVARLKVDQFMRQFPACSP
jgi:hypothetical protein